MEKEKQITFLADRYASQRLITLFSSKKKDSVAPFLADRGMLGVMHDTEIVLLIQMTY